MTQRINNIIYMPTSAVNDRCVFVLQCSSTIDSDWVVQTEGTDNTGGSGVAIKAKYAIVDNLVNQFSCTINFGPMSYGVAPYTRRTFALPDQTPTVEILVTTGTVTLTLCQNDMQVPDEQNQLLSSSVGATVGEYNPFFFCVGQTPSDGQMLFLHLFEEPVFYQPNFNGVVAGTAILGTAPSADYVCDIRKNNVSIGTLTYHHDKSATVISAGGTTGTFGVNDEMTIIGPTPNTTGIIDFSCTFAMTPV